MSKSRVFLYFCLSFIGGIFISSFFVPHLLYLGGGLILGILLISVFWRYKKLVVIGFCLLFLILGIWRHQTKELQIENCKLQIFNDRQEPVSLIGVVSAEPDIREKSQKLTIKIEEIDGRVLVTTQRYPEYQYGDRLKITGELKTPSEDIEGFNYKDYLKKDGIYSVMGFPKFPKIELLERENYPPPNWWGVIFAEILKFKQKLRESIYQNLSPPQSSILGAIILGDKRQLSNELKQKLNVAGVRHITAVSGLHVAVLTTILMTLLIGIGLWRQQAFYFTIIFITLFIVMTGLQPSAIRAGIMGGLFLLAQYLGRMNVSSRTIIFAAAVMLAQNPLLLKLDVGFQLSFLAMFGIIYLSPIFQDWLKRIPNDLQLRNLLAMTLSAQIFTLPILIYNFGYLSLISPLTNPLIVPFLPYIMGLGFLFGLAGIIFQLLGWLFSLPCWLLLTYVIKIVDWFSGPWHWIFRLFPFLEQISFFQNFPALTFKISWLWLPFLYLILGFLTWRVQERRKLKFLNY